MSDHRLSSIQMATDVVNAEGEDSSNGEITLNPTAGKGSNQDVFADAPTASDESFQRSRPIRRYLKLRYGKNCSRCGTYFLNEKLEEMICPWCKRIENGEEIEPALVFSEADERYQITQQP